MAVGAVAIVAVASLGAGSAAATNLCSKAPNGANECPVGAAYGAGQVFEASSGEIWVETSLGAFECDSEIKFKVTEIQLGFAAQAELQAFKFTECESEEEEPCTAVFNPLPPKVQILTTGAGDGKFFVNAKPGAVVNLDLACGIFGGEYQAKEWIAEVTGGEPAEFAFKQTLIGVPAVAGEAEVTGAYETTAPKPLWATK